jgi:hypothetical protein
LKTERDWVDPFTGVITSLSDPETVHSAVTSHAIGIGSFIVPWIDTIPDLEIRHLCPNAMTLTRTHLTPSSFRDERFKFGERLAVQEHAANPSAADATYLATNKPGQWVADIPSDAAVLLHFDLDYFNNRFAGGLLGDNREPDLHEMAERTDALFQGLACAGIQRQIEHISVALSPGFCPSCHWEFLLERVKSGLTQIGLSCPY